MIKLNFVLMTKRIPIKNKIESFQKAYLTINYATKQVFDSTFKIYI